VWQLTSANTLSRLADLNSSGGTLSNTFPAQSITLFVLPAGSQPPRLRTGFNAPPGQLELWLDGQAGTSYALLSSSALPDWLPVSTNLLTSNSLRFLVPTTNSGQKFYRAQQSFP
jgi:hypothetical protein